MDFCDWYSGVKNILVVLFFYYFPFINYFFVHKIYLHHSESLINSKKCNASHSSFLQIFFYRFEIIACELFTNYFLANDFKMQSKMMCVCHNQIQIFSVQNYHICFPVQDIFALCLMIIIWFYLANWA